MRYQYTFRTKASEIWQLSMYYIYGSMVGVCNMIFTAAMFLLIAVRWNASSGLWRLLMLLGCLLFTVFQPLLVYYKACRQAAGIRQDTRMYFDDKGIHINVGEKCSDIIWDSVRKISKKPTMLIIFSDTTHGYILTNRVIGKDREDLYAYITSRMNHGGNSIK